MKLISYLLLLLFVISACKKEEITNTSNNELLNQTKSTTEDGSNYTNNEGTLVLGQQLNNPYTLANMKTAYNNVKSENDPDNLIQTSHYYVRFLPANEEELDELVEGGLELFNYPLDYEILEGGVTYHDPAIDVESITWQYTVVPESYSFNESIQHEILSDLFIPEHIQEEGSIFNGTTIDSDLLDNILIEAYIISGNQADLDQDPQGFLKLKPKWTPKGKIRAFDDVLFGQLEIQGVKVRARKYAVIKTAYTDPNGDYTIGEFRGDVNYSIKWETGQYDIRDRFGVQAMHNGPKQQGDWNLDIVSGKTIGFATVHRAAYRYHYKNRGGLISPKPLFRLNIKYVHDAGPGHVGINFGNNWNLSFFNNIKIWGLEAVGRRDTDEMFHTTIHELAHSAHIKKVHDALGLGAVKSIIRESWAEAVAHYITQIEYNELGFTDWDDALENQVQFNLQMSWDNINPSDYSPLFIDIIDDYNQYYRNSVNCIAGTSPPRSDVCYIGNPPAGTIGHVTAANDYFYYYNTSGSTVQSVPYQPIPSGAKGVVRDNKYYIWKSGLPRYPNDQLVGYSLVQIESALNNIRTLAQLEIFLKAFKPSNITNDDINEFLDLYYNI